MTDRRRLEHYLGVARERNFTRAAQQLLVHYAAAVIARCHTYPACVVLSVSAH